MSSPAQCMAEFEAALTKQDLDAALALLSDDVAFFYSNGSAHFGKDAIRAAIQANFDTIKNDTYVTRDHAWLAQSDAAAACIYSFAWNGTMEGKPVSGRGRGTTAFRHEPAGWRIVHEHLSAGRWKPRAD
jgi:uncharacterized protein (TIGR02246 family)